MLAIRKRILSNYFCSRCKRIHYRGSQVYQDHFKFNDEKQTALW